MNLNFYQFIKKKYHFLQKIIVLSNVIPTISKNQEQANHYDEFQERFHGGRGLEMRKSLVECITTSTKDKMLVLDVGCGTGDISIRVANNFPKAKIIAIDASSTYLDVAKNKVKNNKFEKQIKFKKINLKTIDSNKIKQLGLFDIVISQYVLHYDFNHVSLFGKIHKSMNEGAKIIIGINVLLSDRHLSDLWWKNTEDYSFKWHLSKGSNSVEAKSKAKIDRVGLQRYVKKHVELYSLEKWMQMFKKAGFKDVECVWQDYHDVIMQASK
jgi:tRNA (cmo5U34)-methyltransferase